MNREERQKNRYRGSVTSSGEYASARDFGNMVAGIVAGRKGFNWNDTRFAFDVLQGAPEPKVSQLAQRYGQEIGVKIYNSEKLEFEILYNHRRYYNFR